MAWGDAGTLAIAGTLAVGLCAAAVLVAVAPTLPGAFAPPPSSAFGPAVAEAAPAGTTAAAAGTVVDRGLDETPRVAVIAAFDAELERLREATEVAETRVVNHRTHYLGRLAGLDVVVFQSGVSMVNAAMATQGAVDRYRLRAVVVSGIAGGANPDLRVGDVAVPARWGQYQEAVLARRGPDGWELRASPRRSEYFPNFGMAFPRPQLVADPAAAPDEEETRFWFDADARLLAAAAAVAGQVRLDDCTPAGDCLAHEPRVVVGGRGVSGPTFVDNAAYRTWIWETFRADAIDMETAAVAHVAHVHRVPFLGIRSLSDLAGGDERGNQARVFFRLAAENAAKVVLAVLEEWDTREAPAAE